MTPPFKFLTLLAPSFTIVQVFLNCFSKKVSIFTPAFVRKVGVLAAYLFDSKSSHMGCSRGLERWQRCCEHELIRHFCFEYCAQIWETSIFLRQTTSVHSHFSYHVAQHSCHIIRHLLFSITVRLLSKVFQTPQFLDNHFFRCKMGDGLMKWSHA